MINENKLVIEQINKFGKVPQTHELLQMIERLEQENKKLSENYNRIYNENCKLREEHNITDISLLDENEKLKQENKQLKEKVNKLEILIENLKLGVTLNQEQEDLLDEILFRESRE